MSPEHKDAWRWGKGERCESQRGSLKILLAWMILMVCFTGILLARILTAGHGDMRGQGEAEELPVIGVLPDFELVEASGQPFRIGDLRGKVWVASLFFTHCKASCPMMTSQLNRFQEAVNNPDIVLVSLSIDPERDTPERLREYAELVGADRDRWYFLTGDMETVFKLAEDHLLLGTGRDRETGDIKKAAEDAVAALTDEGNWTSTDTQTEEQPILHSEKFALIDTQGRIRGYYDGLDPLELAMLQADAKFLLTEEVPSP
jgi:cytochrome oxidase Cu insertion factor (SCO1/SenC/PrrC family)